jgi:Phosphotransferase enzyme family
MVGCENGLTIEEYERVRALLADVADRCARLAAVGVPDTIRHDDLHDGNVFVRDGRYLFFDLGDSCVSHPFHTLVVTMRALAYRLELPPGGPDVLHLRDAYLEPFVRCGSHGDLTEAADLAHFTGTAARSLSWQRFIHARKPEFRADDEDAVPYGLRRLLDLCPLGSWSERLDAPPTRVDRPDRVGVRPPGPRARVDPRRLLLHRHAPPVAEDLEAEAAVTGLQRTRIAPAEVGAADTVAGGAGRQSPPKRGRAEKNVPRTPSWKASSAPGEESMRVFAPLSMLHHTAARIGG